MSFRQKLALNAAPIPLRVILAVTFIWAGLGKVVETMPVQGESAAALANLGVIKTAEARPTIPPESETITDPAAPAEGEGETIRQPENEPDGETDGETEVGESTPLSGPLLDRGFEIRTVQSSTPAYTASDFPNPIEVKKVYGLVLLMQGSANPTGTNDAGDPKPSIWPTWAGDGGWVVALAWAAAVTEIVGGLFVLLGLMTRFSALGLAGTMVVALWLTEIGPAIQVGTTVLGFLPGYDRFDIGAWTRPLWQGAMLAMAASLFFTGAGALSIDRLLFEPREPSGEDEDDFDEDDEE